LNTPSLRLEESNANLTANFYIDRDIPTSRMAIALTATISQGPQGSAMLAAAGCNFRPSSTG
jgi:hypothetical protein